MRGFGANLDTSLRDRFASGTKNKSCERRLLLENNPTFGKAFEIALNLDTTFPSVERDEQ